MQYSTIVQYTTSLPVERERKYGLRSVASECQSVLLSIVLLSSSSLSLDRATDGLPVIRADVYDVRPSVIKVGTSAATATEAEGGTREGVCGGRPALSGI